ncbi:MAG: DJ-1/PfpI family protein [Chloroflexota bacterium]
MKQDVYILIFDGLADWEPSFALTEINKSAKYNVVSVGFNSQPVTTMGGLKLIPDITLDELQPAKAALFILPGGDMWEHFPEADFSQFLRDLHKAQVPIAAICGATLAVIRAGLTHGVYHTSNDLQYLQYVLPNYTDTAFYVNEFATSDQNLITANGLGSIEFAREIFKQLQLFSEAGIENWYNMFKHGIYTPVIA